MTIPTIGSNGSLEPIAHITTDACSFHSHDIFPDIFLASSNTVLSQETVSCHRKQFLVVAKTASHMFHDLNAWLLPCAG